jgi:hypothetical protein
MSGADPKQPISEAAYSGAQLPVPYSVVHAHREGPLPRAGAAFISQLIAERQHLPPQRERRRAPMAEAVSSYGHTAEQSVRRLPPGYRTTLLA